MHRQYIALTSLILLIFTTTFSSGADEEPEPTSSDSLGLYSFTAKSWLTPSVPSSKLLGAFKLDAYQVQLTTLYRAVITLENKQFLKLSEEMVCKYIHSCPKASDDKVPYLVRGVSDNPGVGSIAAGWIPSVKGLFVYFLFFG